MRINGSFFTTPKTPKPSMTKNDHLITLNTLKKKPQENTILY